MYNSRNGFYALVPALNTFLTDKAKLLYIS